MKGKVKKIAVLIPDGESSVFDYIINCLGEIPDILVYMMTNEKNTPIQYSKVIYHTSYYEKTSETEWISNINREVETQAIDVILPISEQSIRLLSFYKKNLLHPEKLVPLPNVDDFDTARNKWTLTQHLAKNYINHPQSTYADSGKIPLLADITNFPFPAILKPIKRSSGGTGIQIFESQERMIAYLRSGKSEREYLIQKVINGTDFCSNVFCENGSILANTIQMHTIQSEIKFGPTIGLEFVEKDEIYQTTIKLMRSLNWSGVANIDIRYDAEDQTYHIIEINPRFWGSVEASMFAGVNFPHLCIKYVLRQDLGDISYSKQEYLKIKGLFIRIKSNPIYLFKWKWIWQHTPIKFIFGDLSFFVMKKYRKIFPKN